MLLSCAVTLHHRNDWSLRHHHVGDLHAARHETARIFTQINDEPLHALLLKVIIGILEFLARILTEGRNPNIPDAIGFRQHMSDRGLDLDGIPCNRIVLVFLALAMDGDIHLRANVSADAHGNLFRLDF